MPKLITKSIKELSQLRMHQIGWSRFDSLGLETVNALGFTLNDWQTCKAGAKH